MMSNKTDEEVLLILKDTIEISLEEISALKRTSFLFGEKMAYVECLEIIQSWEKAKEIGLNYDIEERYPVKE